MRWAAAEASWEGREHSSFTLQAWRRPEQQSPGLGWGSTAGDPQRRRPCAVGARGGDGRVRGRCPVWSVCAGRPHPCPRPQPRLQLQLCLHGWTCRGGGGRGARPHRCPALPSGRDVPAASPGSPQERSQWPSQEPTSTSPRAEGPGAKEHQGWLVPPLSSGLGPGEEVPTLLPAPTGVQGPDAGRLSSAPLPLGAPVPVACLGHRSSDSEDTTLSPGTV